MWFPKGCLIYDKFYPSAKKSKNQSPKLANMIDPTFHVDILISSTGDPLGLFFGHAVPKF